jgi:hypothetical protein
MFYELTHVDERPLPTTVDFPDRVWALEAGGLLLEPPNLAPHRNDLDGQSLLRFERRPASMLYASSYPYRWTGPTSFDVASVALGARTATGVINSESGELSLALEGNQHVPPLSLRLRPAPDKPIPPSWRDALFVDGLFVQISGSASLAKTILVQAVGLLYHLGRPWRRRAARRRLQKAWRAPA